MASRVMVPKDARARLDQASFDEAVKTNMDDFGMEVGMFKARAACARPGCWPGC